MPSAPGESGAAGLGTSGVAGFNFWYVIAIVAAVVVLIVAIVLISRRCLHAKVPSEASDDVPPCETPEEDRTLFFNEISREQLNEMSIEFENPMGQHLESMMPESDMVLEDDQDELL
jgi:uncharacterized membrane protein